MNFPTIRIEGSIFSPDILDKIEQGDIGAQLPKDFGFDSKIKVKDEIAKAWADANSQWKIFNSRIENVKESESGNSETRKYWVIPLLGFLGYEVELSKTSEIINGKSYAISHHASNIDNFPVHIMGFKDSLDKRRTDSGPRMSPHSLIQEYINLTEHLFALVTNGFILRLLRDSSRLVKLSYIEFDLEKMFEDEQYSDFALLYRLLHSSRMPAKKEQGPESIIERYHQDALDSGARIREGLCNAVENSIKILGNGFLNNKNNINLRKSFDNDLLNWDEYHLSILRLVYRLLFLMVIEERGLVFPEKTEPEKTKPEKTDRHKEKIYKDFYSIASLRKLCEKRFLLSERHSNYWIHIKNCFRLFENAEYGKPLGVKPLAGELFESNAIGILNECELDNSIILQCLKYLSIYESEVTNQTFRVNYAALSVEEFGSVYEGLLEYKPQIQRLNGKYEYSLVKGSERSSSGSHYTPDELVQPLIKHSLDYIIEDKLSLSSSPSVSSSSSNSSAPSLSSSRSLSSAPSLSFRRRPESHEVEKALLSITVCDVACGSGHILLNAARRIAVELAKVRSGEDQPSPQNFRIAIKDVIKHCIYGVDKNPLAVELCKIALWLESHNPGEPLNFLDHKIKCGDSIVGLAHKEELLKGIPTEAFNRMPDDDKDICSELKKRNKQEYDAREKRKQNPIEFKNTADSEIKNVSSKIFDLSNLPETTPEEVELKKKKYLEINSGGDWWRLKNLADIQVAQFFIQKTGENKDKLITDKDYYELLPKKQILGNYLYKAQEIFREKKFFHWFLEFPEIFEKGGFDCILGNPPFLGGQRLSGTFGDSFLNWVKFEYAPAGSCDLVTYFFRRIYELIRRNGFQALLATNTIAQGNSREGGLNIITEYKGNIVMANRSIRWPGIATVNVSSVSLTKGEWNNNKYLDNKIVENISSFLDNNIELKSPNPLLYNSKKAFIGSTLLGTGFLMTEKQYTDIIRINPYYKNVIYPYINGDDINSDPNQNSNRYAINFFDFTMKYCEENYPICFDIVEKRVRPERQKLKNNSKSKNNWWLYERPRKELYDTIKDLPRVMVSAMASKYVCFAFSSPKKIYMQMVCVFVIDDFFKFSILSSTLHNEWAWKYSSTLGSGTITYSLSDCFRTFPFPNISNIKQLKNIEYLGDNYYSLRKDILLYLQLGLTKTYNLFHKKELTTENIQLPSAELKISKEQAIEDIQKLRELHKQMDGAVLEAYGWTDINLKHDFYEVEYLPENDRIRYTIHPDARKEILKRLLELNHKIHEEEVAAGLWNKKKPPAPKSKKSSFDPASTGTGGLFE